MTRQTAELVMQWVVYRWYSGIEMRRMNPRSIAAIGKDLLGVFDTKAEADRLYKRLKPIQDVFRAEQAASDEAHRQRCQAAAAVRDAAMREIINGES